MGILSRAGDLVYTFRFLKLLVTPWDKMKAFELGLIDNKGKKIKKPETPEEKSAFTTFHRLVFNIKRLIPGKRLGSYAAALLLLREKYGVTDFDRIIKESNIDPLDMLAESSEWYLLEDKRLSPGIYKIMNEKMVNSTCDNIVKPKDKIRIDETCYPIGDVLGLDIYEGTHMKTGQKIYFSVSEISR